MPRPSSLEMVTIIPAEIHVYEDFVFTSVARFYGLLSMRRELSPDALCSEPLPPAGSPLILVVEASLSRASETPIIKPNFLTNHPCTVQGKNLHVTSCYLS